MEEIWKDIQGYEGLYQISNYGRVKSLERIVRKSNGVLQPRQERIMAKRVSTDGYYIAKLSRDGHSKSIAIHRLVASHFIPNPNNLPEVNHKDFDRTNNHVDNLEWCTHLDNIKYSWAEGHYKGRFGKDNPNYGNTVLKERFANNPELAQTLARKGKQNGRCVPIKVIFSTYEKTFDYIGEAAQYLIDKGITNAKVDSIRERIRAIIDTDKEYKGCKFKHI